MIGVLSLEETVISLDRAPLTSFKDLDVYRKAYAMSLEVQRVSASFPKEERYSLTDQMRRCSRSICANIGEGFIKQRHSKAEFRRFLSIAEGSSSETSVWTDYCFDFGYIDAATHRSWEDAYLIISKMLNKLHEKSSSH